MIRLNDLIKRTNNDYVISAYGIDVFICGKCSHTQNPQELSPAISLKKQKVI